MLLGTEETLQDLIQLYFTKISLTLISYLH